MCCAYNSACSSRCTKTIKSEVDECRKIVKSIRTIVRNDSSANLHMPPIDNATSWNFSYKMIESLQNFKEYIENVTEFNISEPDWNFINKFVEAFKPLSECTTKFQLEQYIIGDFYRDWLSCEVELEELVEAIYLNPRFNFIHSPFLLEEQKKTAMNNLLKTQEMMKRLAGSFSKLEAKMNLLIGETSPTDQTTKQKLEVLCNAKRVPFDINILEYWKDLKISVPELGELVDVALSVPSTQVSVERAFSALSTILQKMRSELSKESINNLLLVKLNKTLIEDLLIPDETTDEYNYV